MCCVDIMVTIIFNIINSSNQSIEDIRSTSQIKKAGMIIQSGGTVAFPTETVYGLGADALNPDAVKKIFIAKKRPPDNPLIVHISSIEQIYDLADDISDNILYLADTFWPGPLTMILKRKPAVPDITTCGLDTVAIRMPDNPVALGLIEEALTPIAAPSANLSGRPSSTSAQHVISDLDGRIDAVIDGGPVKIGVESTVVDMTSSIPVILRPGGIGIEDIRKCVGIVRIGYTDRTVDEKEMVRSPGMKYKHYSPQTKVVLVEGSGSGRVVADKIMELVSVYRELGQRCSLLITEETKKEISADVMFSLGSRNDPKQAAHNLFGGLRFLDGSDVDVIIVDGSIKNEGVGTAVLNRLRKAADELIDAG
jgi:L-threonylcarbamoyladenylate synthase